MVNMNTAQAALKDVYLGVLTNQLNNETDPFLSIVTKSNANVYGRNIVKLVPYGINSGINASDETDALPEAVGNKYLNFVTTLKNLYGSIEISDKAIRASSSTQGAFVNLLNAEMEGLINSGKFHLGRMLYGTGDGYLATCYNFSENNYVFGLDSLANIMVGMRVDIVVDGVKSEAFSNVEVKDWNIANKSVTLSVACDMDMELSNDVKLYVHNAGREITGLGAICDVENIATLYGVDRTNVSWLKPTNVTVNDTTFGEAKMLEIIDNISTNWNSNVDMILMSQRVRRKYQSLMANNRINIDVLNLEGGYKALSFNGIPVIADRFVGEHDAYFVDSNSLKLHQLCDWEWLSNDKGQILRQKEGYPVHTATLVKYAELICDKPAGIAKMNFVW